MKEKLERDWDSKIKTTVELHEDSKQWLSEINFIQDEIRFLDHLLGSNYLSLLSNYKSKKEVEKFIFKLNDEKALLEDLITTIDKHERDLDRLIRSKSVQSNSHFLAHHKQLDELIEQFLKKYKKLKKRIFQAVEEIKRDQKKKQLNL